MTKTNTARKEKESSKPTGQPWVRKMVGVRLVGDDTPHEEQLGFEEQVARLIERKQELDSAQSAYELEQANAAATAKLFIETQAEDSPTAWLAGSRATQSAQVTIAKVFKPVAESANLSEDLCALGSGADQLFEVKETVEPKPGLDWVFLRECLASAGLNTDEMFHVKRTITPKPSKAKVSMRNRCAMIRGMLNEEQRVALSELEDAMVREDVRVKVNK